MCKCKVNDITANGENKNTIVLRLPEWREELLKGFGYCPDYCKKKEVSIDACMQEEILALWSKGVCTTGCCCGHNRFVPYVGVIKEHIDKMKELGYKVQYNPVRPCDEDTFFPKRCYIY